MARPRITFQAEITVQYTPMPAEHRCTWEAAWREIGRIMRGEDQAEITVDETPTTPRINSFATRQPETQA